MSQIAVDFGMAHNDLPPDVLEIIREYVLGKKREEDEVVKALRGLANSFTDHEKKDADRHVEVLGLYKGLEARQTATESRVGLLEKDDEITGSWVHGAIEREGKKKRFREWLKNRGLLLTFEIVKWIVIVGLSAGTSHFVTRALLPKVEVSP